MSNYQLDDERAYQEKRMAKFLEDVIQNRDAAGAENPETCPATKLPTVALLETNHHSENLQHFGYVALPGKKNEVKHLRIEVVLEPTGAKRVGDVSTLLMNLDLEIHK